MSGNNSFLLTIGIPTFNGASSIIDAIESCLNSIDFSGSQAVEILVIDNGSTDETFQVVNNFVESYPRFVRLIMNEQNIGLDRNIDKVVENSKGQYVKLLGDDDVVSQDFVKSTLETIKGQQFDVLLNNFLPFDQRQEHKSKCLVKIHRYSSDLNIMVDSDGIAGQIAAITYRRLSYLAIDGESAQGTNHKFLFNLVMLVARGVSLFDSEPKIYVRPGSPRFTKAPIDSYNMQLNALRAYRSLLSNGHKWTPAENQFLLNSVKSQQKYSLSFMDFIHRYTDLNSFEVIFRFYPMGKRLLVFYFKYIPVVLIPKRIGNFLSRIINL
jgi:glycosyltransferase involved in cell wall biosynthesis